MAQNRLYNIWLTYFTLIKVPIFLIKVLILVLQELTMILLLTIYDLLLFFSIYQQFLIHLTIQNWFIVWLMQVLQVLDCLTSYITDRNSCVSIDDKRSLDIPLEHDVPQVMGSVMGVILFNIYIAPLFAIIDIFRILVFILIMLIISRFMSVIVIHIILSLVHFLANV